MITVTDLIKRHDQTPVLNGVTMNISKGEVAAIIGPSGGGKSTLLRCINALEPFQGGRIEIEGLTLLPEDKEHTPKQRLLELRRKVGMVFQQFNLFPHMSVLDNVLSGPIYAFGQSRELAIPQARELLRRVGMEAKEASRPDQLSGGQQQRVAIARALAVNPSAILFDEPTSALDPRMASEVLGVMTDLAKNGQTMMVVTHAMSFARRVATSVHLMSSGKITESGPPEQIFENPREPVTKDFLHQVSGV